MVGFSTLENWIAAQVSQYIIGDPLYLGLLVAGFFVGFVTLQGQKLEGKILVLVPAGILAIAFIPAATIIFALVVAAIMFLAVRRIFNL